MSGRKRKPAVEGQLQFAPLAAEARTAPGVPAIEAAVKEWRANGYRGATQTSRELLNHWFNTDHRLPNGRSFVYHYFQREAIETLIFLWEVEKVRTRTALLERYARDLNIRLPKHDDFARYAIKMATGSGKTKVMSLVIVWQYLNAVREDDLAYARTFLLIAPNVIVFERLRADFEGGHIFKLDPLVPPPMKIFWDFDCVMRDDSERAPADGTLYVTNIQQLYAPKEKPDNEPDIMTAVLGPRPTGITDNGPRLTERIGERDGHLLVINDEAHHTHDEDNEWNTVIRALHAETPLAAQMDFSATPRFQKGQLFPWTVYDYPLKRAIFDNIVKRPVKGVASIEEAKSDIASIRYQGFLVAGVNRWREYREQLEPLGKQPILFLMLNDTKEADDIGDWLRTKYPEEFGAEKTLVIHTNRSGEISKSDLEKARDLARRVDEPDQAVNAIVSVLMLREGWDVQNVTVIVGLRPYTSKANILPEQTIGRGLRLMFGANSPYRERVDIIGNKAFIQFVEDLERIEDVTLDTFVPGKDKLVITSIYPEVAREQYDIGIPQLSPALMRKRTLAEEIDAVDVMGFEMSLLPIRPGDANEDQFRYDGYDILTLEKLVEREYTIPEPQTPQEVIGFYARLIASDLKLPSQFAHLAPKVSQFFEHRAFGKSVDLNDPAILRAMARNAASYVVRKVFTSALRELLIEPATPELLTRARLLSQCEPFPFSRATYGAKKTVFNLVPCDNEFEREFSRFLDSAYDVAAFAKLPQQFGFSIEYTDNNANLRYYYPDFVVRTDHGTQWLIETKGAETIEVAHKDRAAILWCENATLLTTTEWRYLKVPMTEYAKLQADDFEDLTVFAQ